MVYSHYKDQRDQLVNLSRTAEKLPNIPYFVHAVYINRVKTGKDFYVNIVMTKSDLRTVLHFLNQIPTAKVIDEKISQSEACCDRSNKFEGTST